MSHRTCEHRGSSRAQALASRGRARNGAQRAPVFEMLNSSSACASCALEFPQSIQTAATLAIALLLVLGTVGNLLVPVVVCKTKDLRNSTNLFLVNLSVSDLLVLLVCMPTALVELHSQPEVWLLGAGMCKCVDS
ncbi:hypothetical protein MRX96_028436 [Rhipicephalus microplus]